MRAGQPVVFWVSGPLKGERTFRGIWGFGRLTSGAKWSNGLTAKQAAESLWFDRQKATEPGYYVDTRIPLLTNPIPAAEFLADPVLSKSEVVRAQQMSNPVFLTKDEYRAAFALRKNWPSEPVDDGRATVSKRGAGFGTAEQNRKVEIAAMRAVEEHYAKAGFVPKDVSTMNLGWDITAPHRKQDGHVRHVEVKGSPGSSPKVLLTRNEYDTAQSDPDWELAVVTTALTTPQVTIYSARQMTKAASPFA